MGSSVNRACGVARRHPRLLEGASHINMDEAALIRQLVLRSVGYTGVPIPGVPFDRRKGTVLNHEGRVVESEGGGHRTGHLPSCPILNHAV